MIPENERIPRHKGMFALFSFLINFPISRNLQQEKHESEF